MKKNCIICGSKLTKKNKGFLHCLNSKELEKFKNLNTQKECICIDCKKDLLYSTIISPY